MQCSASRVTHGLHTTAWEMCLGGVSDVGELDSSSSSKVVMNKWSAGRGRVSQTLLQTVTTWRMAVTAPGQIVYQLCSTFHSRCPSIM